MRERGQLYDHLIRVVRREGGRVRESLVKGECAMSLSVGGACCCHINCAPAVTGICPNIIVAYRQQ